MKNPLLDLNFLYRLDLIKNKKTYAKIILLTRSEEPVYEIQGKITAGSINIDGASAIRRTCSLTMVSPEVDVTNTYWALKNKFKLEIGVENEIDSQYPDIIWFKQGTYVFTSLNMNVQSNNFTISLNGKDKMCLLNGEVGGTINAKTDFGKLEEYSTLGNGEIVRDIIDIPIVEIIKNAVHVYAGEPLHNIVLNDIENYGLELLEYRGDNNLYMPRNIGTGEVSNLIINKKQTYYLADDSPIYVDNIENKKAGYGELIYYDRTGNNTNIATKVWVEKNSQKLPEQAYNIIKIEYGETAGYRRTELTYPGELVANVGESLVSILDKIKNMFGDFEYFYDIDGRFVFQKKKTYINTSFNTLKNQDNQIYAENSMYDSEYSYFFENGVLLSAFSDAPQILNIRNDFSIWGKRKGAGGVDIPIHMRYAIDNKPIYYKPIRFEFEKKELEESTYQPNKYYIYSKILDRYILCNDLKYDNNKTYYIESNQQNFNVEPFTSDEYDWREIIYQMALDYFKYNHKKDNFTQLVALANPEHYPTGITGYETYYIDMQGFWRQLYHPGTKAQPENWGEEKKDKYYDLFTYQELLEAAREVILQERELIENEDITQLIIDYVYENFYSIRDYFINSIDWDLFQLEEENSTAKDIEEMILYYVSYGFSEKSSIVEKLLDKRWEKLEGKDTRAYKKELEQYSKEEPEYKLLTILSDYRNKKTAQEVSTTEEYIKKIKKQLEKGFEEKSYEIQEILMKRWNQLGGNDPLDYFDLMEKIYIEKGENSLEYQALLILYNFKIQQDYMFIDKERQFITETSINNFNIIDPYLSFLFVMREKKLDNFNSNKKEKEIDNEKLLWTICQILKTPEWMKSDFKDTINLLTKEYNNKDANFFSQEIIDYIYEHYNRKDTFFKIEGSKVWILHPQIKYLFDMRKDKIYKKNEFLNLDNDIFITIILEELERAKEKYGRESQLEMEKEYFKIHTKKRLKEIYELLEEPLDKTDYDFSLEIIDYIYMNYKPVRYYFDVTKNTIEIKDEYIAYLLELREEKILNLKNQKVLSNEAFINIITEAIEDNFTTDEFKNNIDKTLEEAYKQLNQDDYNFAQEIIDYISRNYPNRHSFFISKDDSVQIESYYIAYLLDLRQEKMNNNNTNEGFSNKNNEEFIKIIVEAIKKTTVDRFKKEIEEAKI